MKGIKYPKTLNIAFKIALSVSLIILLVLTGCGFTPNEATFVETGPDTSLAVSADINPDQEIIIKAATGDTNYQTPMIDAATRATTTIEYDHHEIHAGDSYVFCDVTDVGNGDSRTLLMITPDSDSWVHLIWEIEHELEANVKFYEDTVVTNNGTPIMRVNRNRNSSNTAGMLVFHTPTVDTPGTILCETQSGSGKKEGGEGRAANEYILKPNSYYSIVVLNATANNNIFTIQIDWYEHTDKEP